MGGGRGIPIRFSHFSALMDMVSSAARNEGSTEKAGRRARRRREREPLVTGLGVRSSLSCPYLMHPPFTHYWGRRRGGEKGQRHLTFLSLGAFLNTHLFFRARRSSGSSSFFFSRGQRGRAFNLLLLLPYDHGLLLSRLDV